MIISYPPEVFQEALQTHSLYQKHLILDPKIRYKIDLVVKDLQGTKVGAVRQAIVSPSFPKEKLVGSSLILSQFIRPLGEIPKDDQMFVLGDVWIHPSLKKVFSSDGRLGVYLQIYNAALDQTDQTPSLEISYKISSQNGEIFTETLDQNGQSIQFYSPRRVVLIKGLPLRHLKAGRYRVQVLVQDRISDETVTAEDSFCRREEPSGQSRLTLAVRGKSRHGIRPSLHRARTALLSAHILPACSLRCALSGGRRTGFGARGTFTTDC